MSRSVPCAIEVRDMTHEQLIRPTGGWAGLRLGELWRYRDLGILLVWRDIKVRYKQTALGVLWAILQPLAAMVVFTIVFGRIAGVSSGGVPYPIFAFSGLVLWTFFAQSVTQASNSLVASADLIRKVYFPRLLVPVAAVVNTLFDLVISLPALGLLMAVYGISVTTTVLFAPLMVLLAIVSALGVSMWFSALNVAYRDVRHLVPFIVQLWLFLTPVIYPASFVTSFFESRGIPSWVYGLNPMAGAIHGFRWALFREGGPPWDTVILSTVVSCVMLVLGALYFRHVERTMADVV